LDQRKRPPARHKAIDASAGQAGGLNCDSIYAIITDVKVVVDTSVFVSAVLSRDGASREVIRQCLLGNIEPMIGNALFTELEDVCSRGVISKSKLIDNNEKRELLEAFLSVCTWVPIYFLWRPNLPDEADNHVLELAIAGQAKCIVTFNAKDFNRSELRFPGIEILLPSELLTKRNHL
jgi:putative PIN family toxin of toxin-antitoxin system